MFALSFCSNVDVGFLSYILCFETTKLNEFCNQTSEHCFESFPSFEETQVFASVSEPRILELCKAKTILKHHKCEDMKND